MKYEIRNPMNPHPDDPTPVPTYYNQPVIRSGHWHGLISSYFWVGGIAGTSYTLGILASLVGTKEDEEIGRWGRYVATVGLVISAVLLILDLGKPQRFLNMLRIFKPSSPMSVGTWGVVSLSPVVGASMLLQLGIDRNVKIAKQLMPVWKYTGELVGIPLGLFLATYTGVLISNTAVPLWARNRHTNAPVFLSSAFANGAAMLSLLLAVTKRGNARNESTLAHIQLGATVAEAALIVHELDHLGAYLRRPLLQGKSAKYFYGSVLCGLLLPTLVGNPKARWAKILKALLTLLGGFLFRTAIIEGGHEGANDPQAYHHFNDIEQGGH
jgi:formate-dependent nitrite reductase membrane component NrfD